jgi:hypothetical protein
MHWRSAIPAGAVVGAGMLAACQFADDAGYVEIRTVPVSPSVAPPPLYLDTVKLDAPKKGVAVLRQRVGIAKLATEGGGHLAVLCDVVVRKNRVTTVTLSVLDRPPRCQCRNGGSASGGVRTCES